MNEYAESVSDCSTQDIAASFLFQRARRTERMDFDNQGSLAGGPYRKESSILRCISGSYSGKLSIPRPCEESLCNLKSSQSAVRSCIAAGITAP